MDETTLRRERQEARAAHAREFFERLKQRRADAQKIYDDAANEVAVQRGARMAEAGHLARMSEEAVGVDEATVRQMVMETIVLRERPVLFVEKDWVNDKEVTILGD